MTTVVETIERADELMRSGSPHEAQQAYMAAWPLSKELDVRNRVWILIGIANASIRAEDFNEAFNACAAAQKHFAQKSGIVAGNPLFHLLAGIAADRLNEPKLAEDNLARALICGGPAIFDGEAPRYLERMTQLLKPPAEEGKWDGYEGCSRSQLNSISEFIGGNAGYLAELITQRLGAAPPYRDPLSPKDFEGACTDPRERPSPWGNGRVHFVTRCKDDQDVLKFYADLDELPEPAETARIDYEILDDALSDSDARELIVHAYFVAFTKHHYRGRILAFDFAPLGGEQRVRVPYPG